MKIITEINNLNQKIVIVRVDFNVPIQCGKVQDDTRIISSITTIKYLFEHNCKVILISHLGRPKCYDFNLSLKILLPRLQILLNADVLFANNLEEAQLILPQMSCNQIILLENIRFYPEEENNDLDFAKRLASLGDIYINDAFSCSHRFHASISSLPKFLPSFAGINLANEVIALNLIFDESQGPVVAIIGGSKISTKLKLIEGLVNKVKYVVIGGALANNILYARGIDIGVSLFEKDIKEDFLEYKNIVLPCDVVTAKDFKCEKHICDVRSIPKTEKIFDIGPASIMNIKDILNNCKTVLWNGPLGLFEIEKFSNGTKSIANAIKSLTNKNEIKSIIGGGDSACALNKFSIDKNSFTYVSNAGGAFLEWIAKEGLSNLSLLK